MRKAEGGKSMDEERLAGIPALIVVSGSAQPLVVPLSDRRRILTVGRDPDNSIVLDSTMISPHHCRIFFARGTWVIQDTGSATGLVMNGSRVPGKLLEDGDIIRIDASSSRMAAGVMLLFLEGLQDTDRGSAPADGSMFQFGYSSGVLTGNRGEPISNPLLRVASVGTGASVLRVNERARITLNGTNLGSSASLADRDVIRAATGILIYTKSALYWFRANPAPVEEPAAPEKTPEPDAPRADAPDSVPNTPPVEPAAPVVTPAYETGYAGNTPVSARSPSPITPSPQPQQPQNPPQQNAAVWQRTAQPVTQAPNNGYAGAPQGNPYASYAAPNRTADGSTPPVSDPVRTKKARWGIAAGIAVVLWGSLIACLASGFGVAAIPLILVCGFFGTLYFDGMKTGPVAERGMAAKVLLGLVAGVIVTPLQLADLILERTAG